MNINSKVIGLIRLAIKSEPTASEADALTIRPSVLLKLVKYVISVVVIFSASFSSKLTDNLM